MNNIHDGKRNFGTTGIATLTIDQGRVEHAAVVVNIKYSVKKVITHAITGALVER